MKMLGSVVLQVAFATSVVIILGVMFHTATTPSNPILSQWEQDHRFVYPSR